MATLVTGASGFLGSALLPELLKSGHTVYGLSRRPPPPAEGLIPLVGDITKPNLGLAEVPQDIRVVHHLAAIHRLGPDKDGSIWNTNVLGMENVIEFCLQHKIQHLYFTSTAYTQGRNAYEQSKALCETMVRNSGIPRVTIFKPPIIMGTEAHFYPGHFSQFVLLLVKVHYRADPRLRPVRKKIEATLRLPPLEVYRMRANPDGKLNLVPIDAVADAMVRITHPGTYWLTNPSPPTVQQLIEWIGEAIMLDIRIEHNFKPTPVEAMVARMTAPFIPYLWGDDFPSDLKSCPPITEEFIHATIKRAIIGKLD